MQSQSRVSFAPKTQASKTRQPNGGELTPGTLNRGVRMGAVQPLRQVANQSTQLDNNSRRSGR
jgi:hypothetical protein